MSKQVEYSKIEEPLEEFFSVMIQVIKPEIKAVVVSILAVGEVIESAPKWIRGAVITCYQFAITIVNNATQNRPDASAYQIPIGIQILLAFILATGMIALSESPRWLANSLRERPSLKVPASSNPSVSSLSSVSSTFYPQSPVKIFPLNIRAKAVSLSVASNWLWNFIIAFITPYMIDSGPRNANLGVKSQKMNRQLVAGVGDEERTVKDDEPGDGFVVALQ
ncbi:hypothetical protein BC829DRAFT_432093 [Chytridium lagenaria]|nr:hypothetical protein BC829DRAFT_432093 [Chytridium lagenaria]